MNFLDDIFHTNKGILTKSFSLTVKNWKIFLVGFVYTISSVLVWSIAANAWILGGIIIALFQSAIISNYLYLIENIINYERFTLEDFKRGFTVYLRKIYTIIIVFWFVQYGANLFLKPILRISVAGFSLWFIIQIAAFLLLNSLPETIYQKNYIGFDTITYTFNFIKENWLEWFVPNVGLILIMYLVYSVVNNVLQVVPFNVELLSLPILSLIFSFGMIYRGQLYDVLSTSTRRKRMFMRNMYK